MCAIFPNWEFKADCGQALLTRGNIDGHDIFSQLVADATGDSQVHLGDDSYFMGGLAIDERALLLEAKNKHTRI